MKHENAALNSSPHGPSAIPPRQGQSQLISPVSGLNAAACDDASPSLLLADSALPSVALSAAPVTASAVASAAEVTAEEAVGNRKQDQ